MLINYVKHIRIFSSVCSRAQYTRVSTGNWWRISVTTPPSAAKWTSVLVTLSCPFSLWYRYHHHHGYVIHRWSTASNITNVFTMGMATILRGIHVWLLMGRMCILMNQMSVKDAICLRELTHLISPELCYRSKLAAFNILNKSRSYLLTWLLSPLPKVGYWSKSFQDINELIRTFCSFCKV